GVAAGDAAEDPRDSASGGVHDGVKQVNVELGGSFFAENGVPERGVGSVAIGGVGAVDDVGHGAFALEATEGDEQFGDGGGEAGGEETPGADEGVASPIKEPRVTGDNGFAGVAFGKKGAGGKDEAAAKRIVLSKAGKAEGTLVFLAGESGSGLGG